MLENKSQVSRILMWDILILSARFLCQPPLRFNATDAPFPLMSQCRLIKAYLVISPLILVSIIVGKSVRTPLELRSVTTMLSHTLGGIYSGSVM